MNEPEINPDISAAASAFGRMGGKAGTGKAKRRPASFYKKIGKLGAKARHSKTKSTRPKRPWVKHEPEKRVCPKCGGVQTYEENAWVHVSGFAKCPKQPVTTNGTHTRSK